VSIMELVPDLVSKNDLIVGLHKAESVVQECHASLHNAMAGLLELKPFVDRCASYLEKHDDKWLRRDEHCDKEDARTLATMIERVSYIIEVMSANTLADVADPGGKK